MILASGVCPVPWLRVDADSLFETARDHAKFLVEKAGLAPYSLFSR